MAVATGYPELFYHCWVGCTLENDTLPTHSVEYFYLAAQNQAPWKVSSARIEAAVAVPYFRVPSPCSV